MNSRVIRVDQLARVEGEGAVLVKIADRTVTDVKLKIYEPPRFFEAFLRGRDFAETPDITARICGICPVAYQMSAVHALEDAFGITVDGQLRLLRRLLYCGEWIESHVLHIAMLHAPDFLGYEDAFQLAKEKPEIVQKALRMKRIGNSIVALLGGREIHPINVKVGGFYRIPSKKELRALLDSLKWGRDAAVELARVVSTFDFPLFDVDYEFVSLRADDAYPLDRGRIVSSSGLNIAVREFEFYFEERHLAHSHALHSTQRGKGAYAVGPLARFNLNVDRLSSLTLQVAEEIGATPPLRNPFKSIIVRALETLYAYDEAVRIVEQYEEPDSAAVNVPVRAGTGCGATEAPRGLLYHRYRVGDDGRILDANIVPPTAQNLSTIENDVRLFVSRNLDLPRDLLTWKTEQAVRNYDPCISCATHFVRLSFNE